MIIICSWCKDIMGEKEPTHDKRITHSICKSCSDEQLKEVRIKRAKRLGIILCEEKTLANRARP